LQEKWGLDMADPEGHNRSSGARQITDIAEDEIVKEAKLALRPFEVDFQRVDWFTVYVRHYSRVCDAPESQMTFHGLSRALVSVLHKNL
jgi:hypothetical protein